jgi:hypothetical protein
MKEPKTKAMKSLMDSMHELGQKSGVKVTDMSERKYDPAPWLMAERGANLFPTTPSTNGRSVQQVRVANPEGEKLKVEVDVASAREKLIAALSLPPTSGITAMPIFQELCNSEQVAKQGTGYINAL